MKYEGEKYTGIIIMPKMESMSKFYNLLKIKFCDLIYIQYFKGRRFPSTKLFDHLIWKNARSSCCSRANPKTMRTKWWRWQSHLLDSIFENVWKLTWLKNFPSKVNKKCTVKNGLKLKYFEIANTGQRWGLEEPSICKQTLHLADLFLNILFWATVLNPKLLYHYQQLT